MGWFRAPGCWSDDPLWGKVIWAKLWSLLILENSGGSNDQCSGSQTFFLLSIDLLFLWLWCIFSQAEKVLVFRSLLYLVITESACLCIMYGLHKFSVRIEFGYKRSEHRLMYPKIEVDLVIWGRSVELFPWLRWLGNWNSTIWIAFFVFHHHHHRQSLIPSLAWYYEYYYQLEGTCASPNHRNCEFHSPGEGVGLVISSEVGIYTRQDETPRDFRVQSWIDDFWLRKSRGILQANFP